ncbi:hypothetical protein M8494_37525 [Serratia ureilytica]
MREFAIPGREKVWHPATAFCCASAATAAAKAGAHRRPAGGAARLPLACGPVETPKLRLPENQRRAILRALRLAQELGAETATLADPSKSARCCATPASITSAKSSSAAAAKQRWKLRGSFDRLGRLGPDLDLVIVALENDAAQPPPGKGTTAAASMKWRMQLRGRLRAVAMALCALITLLSQWLLPGFDQGQPGDDLSARRGDRRAVLRPRGRRCWRR